MNLTVWIVSIPVMLCHTFLLYIKNCWVDFYCSLELCLLEVAWPTIVYGRVLKNDDLSSMSAILDGYKSEHTRI